MSDAFWFSGTLLVERGMLCGIKARAEQAYRSRDKPSSDN
jgi:hypothetical protein